ncbi:type II toxin-antitoxin system RelE/ParE family toxin [Devosia albogilva]|uniref:Type II toxin-antitoxin system RelE/ParE family toxin n=1 Tax=Devosia albogilva TaxID=429726 RepID=A0ABW5QGA6_9HYPH
MSRWTIGFEPRADKDLQRLSSTDRARVLRYLAERVAPLDDPRQLGKALKADFAGAWRYRVGDIRIITRIEFDQVVVVVLAVGHRGEVYR